MATVIFGDFEWDAEKASSNRRKHGVAFEEAAEAMSDPFSVDFDDIAHPENTVTLAISPRERILYVVTTERGRGCASSAPAPRPAMSDASMKKGPESGEIPPLES